MAVSLVSVSGTTYASRTNTTITAPAGIADNDLLLMAFITANASEAVNPTTPAGWNILPGFTVSENTVASFNVEGRLYYKFASGESGNYTVTHATSSSQGLIIAYAGVDLTTAFSANPTTNTGTGGTSTALGVTPDTDGSLVVFIGHDWGDTTNNLGVPSGSTPTFTKQFGVTANAGLLYAADGTQAVAAATGNKTLTNNSGVGNGWAAFLMALKPAAGGGGATDAGQYGWGTYGAGDYGPNFGGVAATPIAGTDSFAFSEAATVIQISANRTDAFTFTDASAVAKTDFKTATDAFTLADAALVAAALAATDSAAVSEDTTTVTTQQNVAASDSFALTEGAASFVATLLRTDDFALTDLASIAGDYSRTDTFGFTDLASTVQQLSVAGSDSFAFTDSPASVGEQALKAASDSFAFSEAVSLAATLARTDSFNLTDASAVAATLLLTDAATLSEAISMSAALAASDSAAFTDLVLAVGEQAVKFGTDSFALSEGTTLIDTFDLKSVTDSFALTENRSIAAALSVSDQASASESLSLSAALLLNDSATLSEASTYAESRLIAVSDTFSFTDASLVQFVQLKAAADSFGFSDAAFILIPSPSPYVRLPTNAVIVPVSASADILGAPTFTVTITEKSGIAVVTAKMTDVNLDPHAP